MDNTKRKNRNYRENYRAVSPKGETTENRKHNLPMRISPYWALNCHQGVKG